LNACKEEKRMTPSDNPTGNPLVEELRRLVSSIEAAGRAILPGSPDQLLGSIVEAAARIFGAAAASILLVNEAESVLEFKVAYGAGSSDLVGVKIPLNQGIAGYVAMSGQPIAISDVAQDTHFNRDFAKSTGYVPRSILATPLLAGERVIGVMEVLDKIDAPTFGMQDMELLGLFARQAALAIDQAQMIDHIGSAVMSGLKRLAESDPEHPAGHLLPALEAEPGDASQADLLQLVDLLHEFSNMGEAEREMALSILKAVAQYSQAQRKLSMGAGWR
jgi:GAF domain-containing protein